MKELIAELQQAADLLARVQADHALLAATEQAAQLLAQALAAGHKAISCGNGGSHCDAMHFAEELSGKFRNDRPSLAAIAISDASHISCTANDYGYEQVFSRFVQGLGRPGDVLLAISTSGNAANVVAALHAAQQQGMHSILLTGATGGRAAGLATVELRVPHTGYADRIQEIHIKLIHGMIMRVEQLLGHAPA